MSPSSAVPTDLADNPPTAMPFTDKVRRAALLLLCGLGFAFDLVEIWLGNALATVFSAPPHLQTAGAISLLTSSIYIGAIVGAPIFGALADRRGRRTALCTAFAVIGAGSLLAACSPNFASLIAARALSGVAIGGLPPVMAAYLTDLLPARRRGRFILVVFTFGLLGAPVGVFLMRELTATTPFGIDAWRSALFVGACGAGLCAILFTRLPESPAWLSSKAKGIAGAAAERPEASSPLSAIRSVPAGLRARLFAMFFLSPWATVAFPQITGAIYVQKGFKVSDSLLFVGISTFAPIVGGLAVALGVDRVARRTTLLACGAVMAASVLAFCANAQPTPLVVFAAIFNLAVVVYLPLLNTYCAEAVDVARRARVLSVTWAINRVGAAISPLLLIPLARSHGPIAMGIAVAATLGASLLLTWSLPSGHAGRPLE